MGGSLVKQHRVDADNHWAPCRASNEIENAKLKIKNQEAP